MRMPDFITRRPAPTIEAAVQGLTALGVDYERIDIVPVSPLEWFKGEVVGQVPAAGEPVDANTDVTFYVARDGLAERLPHGFLEPLPTTQDEAHVTIEPGHIPEFWEHQVAAYGEGRRFITVLDRAFYRLEKALGQVELALLPIGNDAAVARSLLDLLEIPDLDLDDAEAFLLAARLHELPQHLGPGEAIAALLGDFLGLPVHSREFGAGEIEMDRADHTPIGGNRARLGEGLALGPRLKDPIPRLCLEVGPVDLAEHRALCRDPRWKQRVDALVGFCLPALVSAEVQVVLKEEDRQLLVGDPLRATSGREQLSERSLIYCVSFVPAPPSPWSSVPKARAAKG